MSNNDIIPNISEWIIIGLGYDHIGRIEIASEIADLCWMVIDHLHNLHDINKILLPGYTVPPDPGYGRCACFENITYMLARIMYKHGWVTDIYLNPQMTINNSLDLLAAKIDAINYAIIVRQEAIRFQRSTEKIELSPEEYLRNKILIAANHFICSAIEQTNNVLSKTKEKSVYFNEILERMPNNTIIANRIADYFMLWTKKDKDTVI